MHIIGGKKKGHHIEGPGPGEIRPMRHVVRKALFDMLRRVVEDSNFLDLFAGTGSVGLEALSQGAGYVTFVDNFDKAIEIINRNIKSLDYTEKARTYCREVDEMIDLFDRRDRRFNIVFIGAPYGKGLAEETLKDISERTILEPFGLVALEVFSKRSLKDAYGDLNLIKERDYGQNRLMIFRKDSER